MEEIIYLFLILLFSIIICHNLKLYIGIEGMTLTEDQKRDLEKSKITNAKEWHFTVKTEMPKTETKYNDINNMFDSLKKKYSEFNKEKKKRKKVYKKIRKLAYPDEEDGKGDDTPLCEKDPNQPGCGKVEAGGDYKKAQGEIALDKADPEKDEIPNSMSEWSGG